MNKKKSIVAVLGVMVLASQGSAFAGNNPGAVTFRLADGYVFFAQKREIENTSIPTIELGYNFNEKWGIQAGVSVVNTNIKYTDVRTGAHGFYYLLDGVYHMAPHGNFQPYVLGGVGITSLKVNNTTDPTNEGNMNVGIGAQYFIADNIAFGADARDVYTMSGGKNDVMVTAGITFLFGGSSPEAVKPVYKGEKS